MIQEPAFYYGKREVTFYSCRDVKLDGLAAVPESEFTAADRRLFAANVEVIAFGEAFRPAFRDGDNSNVVATDSMKNFLHAQALSYSGSTLEGYLGFAADRLLARYPQIESLRLKGSSIPFETLRVWNGSVVETSRLLFRRGHGEHAMAALEVERGASHEMRIVTARGGLEQLEVVKLHGNEFSGYVQDEYTTLPETSDRPLLIHMNLYWSYGNADDALGGSPGLYVPAEQVRDVALSVFEVTHTKSIQHLVHCIGQRLLERFPQIGEVTFEAQNRTWDTVAASPDDPNERVFTDPRRPYGVIGLTVRRAGSRGADPR